LEICPTQALASPRVLDATKCISYLTIESRKIPAEEMRKSMGDWFFGCDLCQTICPWNQKFFKTKINLAPQTTNGEKPVLNIKKPKGTDRSTLPLLPLTEDEELNLISELQWILTSSNNQILKKVKGTPYHRSGGKGLKRNALIVAANRKLKVLRPEIQALIQDGFLGELAQWALQELDR
jgi:epoxyqueuosine reductase